MKAGIHTSNMSVHIEKRKAALADKMFDVGIGSSWGEIKIDVLDIKNMYPTIKRAESEVEEYYFDAGHNVRIVCDLEYIRKLAEEIGKISDLSVLLRLTGE